MAGLLAAVAVFLCIPFIHEPVIRLSVISEGELGREGDGWVGSVMHISKALMLIGCLVLTTLRVLIPLFFPLTRLEAQHGLMLDW